MKKVAALGIVLALLLILLAALKLRGCGAGAGPGGGAGASPAARPDTEYFIITVSGSSIRAGGREVAAEEAVRLAKADGRPLMVVWERAYTDAENALKAELLRRDLPISSEQTR